MVVGESNSLYEVYVLETRSVIRYVMTMAWPSEIDKVDTAALGVFEKCWQSEEPYLEEIADLLVDADMDLTVSATYRFATGRLNFARWSHLLSVVPPLIEDEIELLKSAQVDQGEPLFGLIDRLVQAKSDARDAMIAAHAKNQGDTGKATAADAPAKAAPSAADDGLGFRDADMPIEDRLAKAKGKSKQLQLWAAMAQTDCTACGYDCEGYAEAIAKGEEKDLSKCTPGEDETLNAIKAIVGA